MNKYDGDFSHVEVTQLIEYEDELNCDIDLYNDIRRGEGVNKFDVHQRLMLGTETVYKIPKKKKKKEK